MRRVGEYEASCSDDAVYQLQEVSCVQPAIDRFVTLKLRNSGNYVKFQLDTGAECNVRPLYLYMQTAGDVRLSNVTPCNDTIVAFGGTKLILRGRVVLPVSRGETRCTPRCNLVEAGVLPLLGRKAFIGTVL